MWKLINEQDEIKTYVSEMQDSGVIVLTVVRKADAETSSTVFVPGVRLENGKLVPIWDQWPQADDDGPQWPDDDDEDEDEEEDNLYD